MSTRRWRSVVGPVAMAIVAAAGWSGTASGTVGAAPGTTGPGNRHGDDRLASMPVDIRPLPVGVPPGPEFGGLGASTVPPEAALTNADAWHATGVTGAGVKIGVIDFFDVTRFWNPDEHGPFPVRGVSARCFWQGNDCTESMYDGVDEGGDDHGIAVVEILKDMAPDAEVLIGTAYDIRDYRALIDWFHASGVRIVSRSLGSRYDGPGDGRGNLDDLAAYANSLGLTWVNSGGNNGRDRYYRQPVRLVGDRVAFGPAGDEATFPFNGCVSLGGVRWANDWDLPPEDRTDYDIYLWEMGAVGSPDRILARSEGDQRGGDTPIEVFPGRFCPSTSTSRLHLEIRWRGGDITGDVIEVLDYGHGLTAYTQAAYSASTPIADSALPGVLAVGAVDPPGSDRIGPYSSQGPTNDGRVAPDLSAPSGFTSNTFGSAFSGTSAAAPVVAGAAALLLEARLASDPASVGNLLRHLVVDRGPVGPDDQFGAGELRLPEPPAAVTSDPSSFDALSTPVRILDTRPESAVGPPVLTGRVAADEIIDLPLDDRVPGDVTAVAVNLTVVDADRPSFAQVLPTLGATLGGSSNLNLDAAGQTRSNFAIVPVNALRSLSVYLTGGGHVVIDLLGTFRAAPGPVSAGRFVGLEVPRRVLDTRLDPAVPLDSGSTVAVSAPEGVAEEVVDALVVTVTATGASGPGWLQIHPAGARTVVGTTSTVNVAVGESIANTAIVPIGVNGLAVSGFFADAGSTHVVVDVVGYITSDGAVIADGGRYVPIPARRAFDSRTVGDGLRAGSVVELDAGAIASPSVPPDASGAIWNITHVDVRGAGFGRVWAADAAEPATSAFNFSRPAEVRATAVVSALDSGRASVSISDGTQDPEPLGHVVADVMGYFT